MKIIDITQELFCGKVYPGDMIPSYQRVSDMSEGDLYNLTSFQMGAHNATHIDAPFHFYQEGKTIEQIELSRCIGPCTVIAGSTLQVDNVEAILEKCQKRLLIKGDYAITLELAKTFNAMGIVLIGVEGQSVGPEETPMPVHLELLGKEVVLLEGVVLEEVQEGEYFLFAVPLKTRGSDGAPCRAILLKFDEYDTCIY